MTAGETVGACIATAIGLYLVGSWALGIRIRRSNRRRWKHTTRQAARAPRTEAEVQHDLDAAKAARRQIQRALDLAECEAIWGATQHGIPHQTRRTEDNQ